MLEPIYAAGNFLRDVQITIGRIVLSLKHQHGHNVTLHNSNVLPDSIFILYMLHPESVFPVLLILNVVLQRTFSEIFKKNFRIGKQVPLRKGSQRVCGRNWRYLNFNKLTMKYLNFD